MIGMSLASRPEDHTLRAARECFPAISLLECPSNGTTESGTVMSVACQKSVLGKRELSNYKIAQAFLSCGQACP
jgi:hypothetical protein